MTTIRITENEAKTRVDVFLVNYFKNKYQRNFIQKLIDEKIILINKKETKPSYKLKIDDNIEFFEDKIDLYLNKDEALEPYNYKLNIIYEDNDVIVVNKPKQMLTHPTKYDRKHTLVNALLAHCKTLSNLGGADRLGIVHRLDKNTSGLIICAKNNLSCEILAEQIKEKTAKRKYLAVALGEFEENEGIIDKALVHYIKDDVKMTIAPDNKGLSATTIYKVIERFKGATLVELELKTGRTHQIRAHLASINHPVFGDTLYGAKGFNKKEFNNLKTVEQLLQSYYICFNHPKTKEKMEFELKEKDFSEDFIKVLNFLRRTNEH